MSATRPQQRGPGFLADYVTVHERIEKFYEKYPGGRIVTELMSVTGDPPMVCFKACGYRAADSAEPDATGHAIDKLSVADSTFEKTETAAVGRMLANMGFEVKQGVASREEVERATRNAQPASRQPEYSETNWRSDGAKNRILDLEAATGKSVNSCRDWLEKKFSTRAPWVLSMEDLKSYAEWLKGQVSA
jgi:hypothetical protein